MFLKQISKRKICPYCDEIKELSSFKHKQGKCKECYRKYQREYYQKVTKLKKTKINND